jgi:exodeoxyribonuclease VII small subunit
MKTYKELEDELHAVLDRVENASYDDLDDLLKDYASGMKLIEELQKKLKTAKNIIKKAKNSK